MSKCEAKCSTTNVTGGSMIKTDLSQGTADWLTWRKSKIGASDIPIIMGTSPWKTPYQLWLEKTGRKEQPKSTPAMERGTRLEAVARKTLEEKLGFELIPAVLIHAQYSWAVASIDGMSLDGTFITEIKWPNKETHADAVLLDKIPEYYMQQCQWQLYVSDLKEVTYSSHLTERDHVQIQVARDQVMIDELVKKADEFMDCLINDYAPGVQERDYVLLETDKAIKADTKCHKKKIALDKAKEEFEDAKKELVDCTDGGNAEGPTMRVTRVYTKGSIDYKAACIAAKIPEETLNEFRKKPSGYIRVTMKK